MRILSAAVKTGRVLYIGTCGGASMAGMYYVPFQQEMMGFVPGVVMIADNEEQAAEAQKTLDCIKNLTHLPRFWLTKQVAMMVRGSGGPWVRHQESTTFEIRPPCGGHPQSGQASGVPAKQPTAGKPANSRNPGKPGKCARLCQ